MVVVRCLFIERRCCRASLITPGSLDEAVDAGPLQLDVETAGGKPGRAVVGGPPGGVLAAMAKR
jgi:hypothetical protein